MKFDIDTREWMQAFARLEKQNGKTKIFFEALKPDGRQEIRDHQKKRQNPEGDKWPGYAASTKNRRRTGRRLLKRLPRILKSHVQTDSLTFRSPVAWAGVHINGGTAGNGARIPRRDFMWFSRPFMESVSDDLAKWVFKKWEK